MECTCRIPELGDHSSYTAAIEALPLVQTPEVFGLHANADISYYTSATKALWRNLVGFLVNSLLEMTLAAYFDMHPHQYLDAMADSPKEEIMPSQREASDF